MNTKLLDIKENCPLCGFYLSDVRKHCTKCNFCIEYTYSEACLFIRICSIKNAATHYINYDDDNITTNNREKIICLSNSIPEYLDYSNIIEYLEDKFEKLTILA